MAKREAGAPILERCPWPGIQDPLYAHYHDTEWGVPNCNDALLFEKLILEGFQAGLSWITILRKRQAFRRAFDGFDAERIARYQKKDIARLMNDAGIVRNRLKIEATIDNARAYLALRERTTLAGFLWSHLEGGPLVNRFETLRDVPAKTRQSEVLSRSLKQQGFRFVGPTTMYAFMQATGIVNDHLTACPRHAACLKLGKAFKRPK